MDISHDLITLSSSSAIRIPATDGTSVNYSVSFSVQNVHENAIVYIGGNNVTDGDYGIKLLPNAIASFENVQRNAGFYAISDTDESQVAILKMSM